MSSCIQPWLHYPKVYIYVYISIFIYISIYTHWHYIHIYIYKTYVYFGWSVFLSFIICSIAGVEYRRTVQRFVVSLWCAKGKPVAVLEKKNCARQRGDPCPAQQSPFGSGKNLTRRRLHLSTTHTFFPSFRVVQFGPMFSNVKTTKGVLPLAAKQHRKWPTKGRSLLTERPLLLENTHPKTGPKFFCDSEEAALVKLKYRWDIRKCCMCHQFSRSACFFHLISLE